MEETIELSRIDLGERGRTIYRNVEELAESISQHGLIQPLGLEPSVSSFLLRHGGRRYHALKLLGTETLYHGVSSLVGRPGFLYTNVEGDVFRGLMIEIAENHDREDIDWRDDIKLIVKAYRLWEQQKHLEGETAVIYHFSRMIGVGYADIKQGLTIHDDLVAHPDRYVDCGSVFSAYQKILAAQVAVVAKVAAQKSLTRVPAFREGQQLPATEPATSDDLPVINLSASTFLGNGLDFMAQLPPESFDHVVTDPDYAVDLDRLEAAAGADFAAGVVQDSASESLRDLERFITEAYRITKHFCVFWYDLDHHEKLMNYARSVGWRVQRWPLIWIKLDPPANGAPYHNFPKCTEYAMVLRKPSTTLVQVQRTNTYTCAGTETVKRFGHPFAKPIELWKWIYSAITIKGQSVLDPFAGKGTAPVAAIDSGLRPVAAEIQELHFHDLTLNLQAAYRKALSPNIRFV